uniref:Uncharacterized protein n=1 Tax=Romanomermis culicivorax TaxID=13658 RepID=A0A915IR47_ROMCU
MFYPSFGNIHRMGNIEAKYQCNRGHTDRSAVHPNPVDKCMFRFRGGIAKCQILTDTYFYIIYILEKLEIRDVFDSREFRLCKKTHFCTRLSDRPKTGRNHRVRNRWRWQFSNDWERKRRNVDPLRWASTDIGQIRDRKRPQFDSCQERCKRILNKITACSFVARVGNGKINIAVTVATFTTAANFSRATPKFHTQSIGITWQEKLNLIRMDRPKRSTMHKTYKILEEMEIVEEVFEEHPCGPKPNVPVEQRSQRRPTTFGLH